MFEAYFGYRMRKEDEIMYESKGILLFGRSHDTLLMAR